MNKLLIIFIGTILAISLSYAQVTIGEDPTGVEGVVIEPPTQQDIITLASGNITTFLNLTDTPSSYVGEGGDCVAVNVGETGLEFIACGAGSAGTDYSNVFMTNQSTTGDAGINVSTGAWGWFKGLFNWVTTPQSYVSFNGSALDFNETHLNKTIRVEGVASGFNSTLGIDIHDQALNTTSNTTFDYLNVTGKMGINLLTTPFHTLEIIGDLLLTHTATSTDEHGLEIKIDADGFGDVKGIDIIYDTGAIELGEDEEVILINIDEFKALGGDVVGLEVIATEGSAEVFALEAGVVVSPIIQLSGVFDDMDSVDNNGNNHLAQFISTASDVTIFASDNDYVTLGNADKFEEIEFILNTTSSKNIKPTFEFSTGIGAWSPFTPSDGTNGLENNGVMLWLDEDIPSWETGTGGEYLIRITRTRNNILTVTIENLVQISSVIEYYWNKNGNILINNLTGMNITATDHFIGNGSLLKNTPSWNATYDSLAYNFTLIPIPNNSTLLSISNITNFLFNHNQTQDLSDFMVLNGSNAENINISIQNFTSHGTGIFMDLIVDSTLTLMNLLIPDDGCVNLGTGTQGIGDVQICHNSTDLILKVGGGPGKEFFKWYIKRDTKFEEEVEGTPHIIHFSHDSGAILNSSSLFLKSGEVETTATKCAVMEKDGSIVGMSLNIDIVATDGGGLLINTLKNGGAIWAESLINSVGDGYKYNFTQVRDTDDFVRGDCISQRIKQTTGSGQETQVDDIISTLRFYYDGVGILLLLNIRYRRRFFRIIK